jgi:hypothetical protein
MAATGQSGSRTADAPQVVASVCCDLGGSVRDWRKLVETLKADGYPRADRWDRSEEAWQRNYRITHPPVLLVESEPVALELEGLAADRPPTREIRIYPAGVVVFRYILPADAAADVDLLYDLRQQFQRHRLAEYISYLRDFYGELDQRRPDEISEPTSDAGISMIPTLELLKGLCDDGTIEKRPDEFPALYARWAICVSPRRDRVGLEADLQCLADAKQLPYPADTLDGLISSDAAESLRLRAWPGLALASWEGFDVYLGADTVDLREAAVDSLELSHQFAFLCRAWIEILDRLPTEIPTEELIVPNRHDLERRMLEWSALERSLSASMVEIDSTDVMLVDPLWLDLAFDYGVRFKLGVLKAMVFGRLDALDRQTAVVRDVLDRNYQEAVNKQGERLQLLFAGAVAAQIAALVPATAAAPSGARLPLAIVVPAVTILLWFLFVMAARWLREAGRLGG